MTIFVTLSRYKQYITDGIGILAAILSSMRYTTKQTIFGYAVINNMTGLLHSQWTSYNLAMTAMRDLNRLKGI